MSDSFDAGSGRVPGGYREVLAISFPLILSTSTMSLAHVIDRVFLSWYSSDSLAASLPAGASAFVFLSLFIGTTSYVNTFVSQYHGAGRPDRIGASVWQGIYLSLIAAVAIASMSLIAEPLFRLAGHPPAIREQEVTYFRIMALGGGGPVLSAALSAFYSGRGRTWMVMWVNLGGALVNCFFNYLWIFGNWGFPEWGIFGAALASILAPWLMSIFYFSLLFLPRNRTKYSSLSAWRFDPDLFRRLIRYGFPSGLQFMTDVSAFTIFILLIGRIGAVELAASNIAFAVNHLVFMPMVGLAIGTSVLVGRYLGANKPDLAARSTTHAFQLTLTYMSGFALLLLSFPGFFIACFDPGNSSEDFAEISRLARHLLYFVAAYSTLDATNIIYTAALKGAGDTRFVLLIMIVVSLSCMVVPVLISCVLLGGGIYIAWFFLWLWVVVLAGAFYWRYRAGHWRGMRVIEHAPAPAAAVTEGPVVEAP